MSVLPSIVKQLRIDKGWTQERLALVAGLSYRTIQRIERDGRCSLDSKMALSLAFDVDFSELSNERQSQQSVGYSNALKNEALLTLVAETLKTGAWELDLVTMEMVWTKQVYDIYQLDETLGIQESINFYPVKVRPTIQQAFNALVGRGLPYDLELPLITAKGQELWVRVIGGPHYASGQLIKVSGTIQDITHLKTI